MKWVNFLHLYQPPTQTKEILDLVTHESYSQIASLLEKFPDLKLSLNISGSLLELLEQNGHQDLIRTFSRFVTEGRIELVDSAMYHPILPLIPETEVRKQISMHREVSKRLLHADHNPKGFYLPEMAYSSEIGQTIKSLGYDWVILDEIHANGEKVDPEIKYKIKEIGLSVVFRERKVSKTFPPEFISTEAEYQSRPYVITAHDGELYGHWHKDDQGYYKKAFTNPKIRTITISEYLSQLKSEKEIEAVNASWESTPEELENDIPFALWNDPKNIFHQMLWALANYCISTINKNLHDNNIQIATIRLHRGLASCAWWWATERKLGVFSPESWNPTEIEKGAQELLTAVRALKDADPETHIEAERIFSELRDTVWEYHWQKTKK